MAKGPNKGADYLARERGLIKPRFTTSCASLFEDKGNPWLTDKEQADDFPLSRSREGFCLSPEQQTKRDIYERARSKLEAQGVAVPKAFPDVTRPSLHVDPDMDMFTKAGRPEKKAKYVDPVGVPTKQDHARWRANLIQKTRLAMKAVSVNVPESTRKKEKIRGNFFLFDAPEMTDEKLRKLREKRKRGRR